MQQQTGKYMKKAFTLIELVIVIAIIALLSTLGLSTYNSVQQDARNAKRKADLKEMQKALQIYRQEKGSYPSTVGRAGCSSGWWSVCNI